MILKIHEAECMNGESTVVRRSAKRAVRIFVTGTRGIPDIQGGVEFHCQALYPLIVAAGCEITLATRRPYVRMKNKSYMGVRLVHLPAPHSKSFEALFHTFTSVIVARLQGFRVIHIHAIGPSIFVPLARLLGMRVVMTHHGPEYMREKWGRLARAILRTGERWGVRCADVVVAVSRQISDHIFKTCGRTDVLVLPNGVNKGRRTTAHDYCDSIGAEPGTYVLAVGRFVPEKGFHDLIRAFHELDSDGLKLIIAGDADHITEYSERLRRLACDNDVILAGFVTGRSLEQLYSHARLFVLPSSHEGTSLALLEAMAYGLDIIVSDIPANREIGLEERNYFRTGYVDDLVRTMRVHLSSHGHATYFDLIRNTYSWEKMAYVLSSVYRRLYSG
jgi:glycosyltransferase involved in cell wall biosynthesis